tara:strand:+ start:97 stop:837 length:741 start_codon:yes stop_codon:yes gene_type:complete
MDLQVGNNNIIIRFLAIIVGVHFLAADENRDPSFEFNYTSSEIHVGADSVGTFNGTIHNLSTETITITVVRRVNELPNNWSSSVCLGMICYNEAIDSVSVQIGSGDSSACGVLAWISGPGEGTVQLDIFDLDSDEHLFLDINFYAGMVEISKDLIKPNQFLLFPAYPNPFNPVTRMRFNIPVEMQHATILQIFDVNGRPIVSLVNRVLQAGQHEIEWSASGVPSGVYFAEFVSGNYRQVQKMVLMK